MFLNNFIMEFSPVTHGIEHILIWCFLTGFMTPSGRMATPGWGYLMIPTPGGGNRLKSDPGMQKELKNPKNAANPYKPKGSQVTTTCVSIISGDINPPIVQIAIPNEIAFDLKVMKSWKAKRTPTRTWWA